MEIKMLKEKNAYLRVTGLEKSNSSRPEVASLHQP
jgi:hypothetical protein